MNKVDTCIANWQAHFRQSMNDYPCDLAVNFGSWKNDPHQQRVVIEADPLSETSYAASLLEEVSLVNALCDAREAGEIRISIDRIMRLRDDYRYWAIEQLWENCSFKAWLDSGNVDWTVDTGCKSNFARHIVLDRPCDALTAKLTFGGNI